MSRRSATCHFLSLMSRAGSQNSSHHTNTGIPRHITPTLPLPRVCGCQHGQAAAPPKQAPPSRCSPSPGSPCANSGNGSAAVCSRAAATKASLPSATAPGSPSRAAATTSSSSYGYCPGRRMSTTPACRRRRIFSAICTHALRPERGPGESDSERERASGSERGRERRESARVAESERERERGREGGR